MFAISRDLNQSINKYLHEPALPIYIIDEIDEVLKDIFKSSYGEFLLKFGGTEELMAVIE